MVIGRYEEIKDWCKAKIKAMKHFPAPHDTRKERVKKINQMFIGNLDVKFQKETQKGFLILDLYKLAEEIEASLFPGNENKESFLT